MKQIQVSTEQLEQRFDESRKQSGQATVQSALDRRDVC